MLVTRVRQSPSDALCALWQWQLCVHPSPPSAGPVDVPDSSMGQLSLKVLLASNGQALCFKKT